VIMILEHNRIQINGQWYPLIPREVITEIFKEFCRENPNFRQYLTESVLPFLKLEKVHWAINPSLNPLGEAIPDYNSPPHFYCIVLRRNPIVPDDEFLIAHELGHCVFNELLFPIVNPDGNLALEIGPYSKLIFNAFNSMIYDKMVNAKLKNFCLDLTSCIETSWPNVHVRNDFEKIFQTFRYVIRRRSARLLIDSNPEYERDLLTWYSENFPDIKSIGDEIFEILERDFADSPEKIIDKIQQISLRYHWRGYPNTFSIIVWIRKQV
jgi:hypothetical protein